MVKFLFIMFYARLCEPYILLNTYHLESICSYLKQSAMIYFPLNTTPNVAKTMYASKNSDRFWM